MLRHCNYDLSDIAALRCLERLELRGGALEDIAPVAGTSLRALTLHGVRGLRDFGALASAPALRLVRLEAMPQIRPADLAVLARCERLQVRADSGNRTLDREIQRVFVRERTRP